MLTGENGVITKASKAKIETELAAVKEELSLSLTNWTMQKEPREPLKEYIVNSEKSGLENVQIIEIRKDEQGKENVVGMYKKFLFIGSEEGDIEISKTQNLVRNGILEEKNNSNFECGEYKDENL